MIRIVTEHTTYAVDPHVLSDLVQASLPGFMTGAEPAQGQQVLLKTAMKGIMPLLLGMVHKEIETRHLPIPSPDLKCPAARENIITYTVDYFLSHMTALADNQVFGLAGHRATDGSFVITGLTAAPSEMAAVDAGK